MIYNHMSYSLSKELSELGIGISFFAFLEGFFLLFLTAGGSSSSADGSLSTRLKSVFLAFFCFSFFSFVFAPLLAEVKDFVPGSKSASDSSRLDPGGGAFFS